MVRARELKPNYGVRGEFVKYIKKPVTYEEPKKSGTILVNIFISVFMCSKLVIFPKIHSVSEHFRTPENFTIKMDFLIISNK